MRTRQQEYEQLSEILQILVRRVLGSSFGVSMEATLEPICSCSVTVVGNVQTTEALKEQSSR